MKSAARATLLLLVTLIFAAGTIIASAAEYHPVLFAHGLWVEGNGEDQAGLWGGYAEDGWKDLSGLPLKVQGQTVAEGECPEFEEGSMTVETPLLRVGQKLAVFSAKDGSPKGTATVQAMRFVCWGASGQWDITASIKSDQKNPAPLEEPLILLGESQAINIPATKVSASPEKISFSADAGPYGSAVEVRYTKDDQNEDEQIVFDGALLRDGKQSPFGQAYVESAEQISGFFADFQTDGKLEFVYFVDGPAGNCGIKSISKPDAENDLISIDTGE